MTDIYSIVSSIILLFIVLDPVGVSPYVASIVSRRPEGERERIVRTALASAGAILLSFTLIGSAVLDILGVSMDEFKVAAGLLLLIYATADLFEIKIGYSEPSGDEVAVFPLATPLLAGPGSIATVMYIMGSSGVAVALIAIAVNLAVAYPILYASLRLTRLLGRHGSLLVAKFTAFLMVGFAVSIIFDGLRGIMPRAFS
ncbi:MarC family protein [Aeropyrum camini]|uniref:UPF0056 membrane protein n=1 Tax=Aeropyrum camini SY1 = JCM 12091 TaxID=1198449 RepID=U3TF04_9CREN|nr:MarC family protein [Aeropyrum camini]BAN91041.1 small neutral amino acid transporter [Aeropyrum camini SY1 = JCM 12091]